MLRFWFFSLAVLRSVGEFFVCRESVVDSCSCAEKACAVLHLGWLHPICCVALSYMSCRQSSPFQLQCSLTMNSQSAAFLSKPTAVYSCIQWDRSTLPLPGCRRAHSGPWMIEWYIWQCTPLPRDPPCWSRPFKNLFLFSLFCSTHGRQSLIPGCYSQFSDFPDFHPNIWL